MNDLGNLVRHWVHYDTLVADLNRQVQVARQTREKFEDEIIQRLKQAKYEKAIIQIAGGRLIVNEEKHSQPLTFKSLEELLHAYYRSKPGSVDDTANILKYIKSNRSVELTTRLKKILASLPPKTG